MSARPVVRNSASIRGGPVNRRATVSPYLGWTPRVTLVPWSEDVAETEVSPGVMRPAQSASWAKILRALSRAQRLRLRVRWPVAFRSSQVSANRLPACTCRRTSRITFRSPASGTGVRVAFVSLRLPPVRRLATGQPTSLGFGALALHGARDDLLSFLLGDAGLDAGQQARTVLFAVHTLMHGHEPNFEFDSGARTVWDSEVLRARRSTLVTTM